MNAWEYTISDSALEEWQRVVDLVVRIAGVRVGLIMRINEDSIEVFVASKTNGNPYHVGEKEHLGCSGLYCEAVINNQDMLLVSNALQSTVWNNNPDLKYNLVSYLGFPIRLPNGRPFGTICLLDDKENDYSPELIELMEKMRELIESQLDLAEKTRELSRTKAELEAFTFTVAHDIKPPLRAIAGYAEFLKENKNKCLNDEDLGMVTNIQRIAADRIDLVNKLLEYARTAKMQLKVESVDMGSLFIAVYTELAAQYAGRHVAIKLDKDMPLVKGDRVLLREVCANILANAFKFTYFRQEAQITVRFRRTAKAYVFSVQDNGAGFDPQYADKLFGIFERLHTADEFPGHGIGLATVQNIIQKHGGQTWMEGALDQGVTIYFTLPIKQD